MGIRRFASRLIAGLSDPAPTVELWLAQRVVEDNRFRTSRRDFFADYRAWHAANARPGDPAACDVIQFGKALAAQGLFIDFAHEYRRGGETYAGVRLRPAQAVQPREIGPRSRASTRRVFCFGDNLHPAA